VKAWISVLEASGQILVVRPYHANIGTRLVKSPKVYFVDTGTLAYLLDLREPGQVLRGVAAGPFFEAAVLGQLLRLFVHRGETPRLYFWRTASGHEVDFVAEIGSTLIPIEAKLTATPSTRDAAAIELSTLFGDRVGRGLVVCLCQRPAAHTRRAVALLHVRSGPLSPCPRTSAPAQERRSRPSSRCRRRGRARRGGW
jgi:predicted AAA+ superfamily ATPase